MSVSRVFVVCPVYRDTAAYAELRTRIAATLHGRAGIGAVHFVAVDDTAGEDADLRAMRDATTRVLVPPYNLGHQGAIVFGLRELAASLDDRDIVITMDSDGEDRPEDIPALLAPLLEQPDDAFLVSVARRTQRHESFVFRVGYTLFKALFRILTGVVVRSGNFAAMRGALVAAAIGHPCFDQCYSSSLISLRFRRRDVPIARGTRYAGESRMGFVRLVTHGMHMLMPFLDRVAVRCLLASSGVLAIAAVVALVVATRFALGQVDAPLLAGAVAALAVAGFGILAALALFSTAARSRAQSVRVLHPELRASSYDLTR